ncbi:antitoxin [Acinetobacter guillouiae]|uniref:type II toxin-antitoxin system RelB family antitoxin n=1 Tax=Acinetobacter guillouiae TaxID=106649 RepID=UPI003AF85D85
MSENNEFSSVTTESRSSDHEKKYNEWFKEKVEKAMNDTRPTIPHNQVVDHLQKRRVEQSKKFSIRD